MIDFRNRFKPKDEQEELQRGIFQNRFELAEVEKTERLTPEESESRFQEYLKTRERVIIETQRERRNAEGQTSRETPTFEQMMAQSRGVESFEGRRSPMIEFRKKRENIQNAIGQSYLGLQDSEKKEVNQSFLREFTRALGLNTAAFFFGTGKPDQPLGTGTPYIEDIKSNGAIGFLYETILKSRDQKAAERYESLLQVSGDPERAFRIAQAYEGRGEIPIDITDEERRKMRNYGLIRGAFVGLELADLLLVGKPVNTTLKVLNRGSRHNLFTAISSAESREIARKVAIQMHPELANKEGLEELIDIARTTSNYDSWSKNITDLKSVQRILDNAESSPTVSPTTPAQQVFFQGGVPTLRGQADTATSKLVELRNEIRNVMRGQSENTRLSNPNIFADEVRAGSIPFKQTTDEPIKVFLTGGKITPTTRLSLSREVAESIGEGTVRTETLSPNDLVRLSDGTFVYAPKSEINRWVQPSLDAIRLSQRDRVVMAEKIAQQSKQADRLLERTSNQIAERKARKETLERKAVEEAKRLAQAEKITKAQQAIEAAKGVSRTSIAQMRKSVSKALRAIDKNEKNITKLVQRRALLLKDATQKAGLTPGRFIQKFGDFMTATEKAKLKSQKTLSSTERSRIQARIRKSLDSDIDALKANKNQLQANWREASANVAKSKLILKAADEAKTVIRENAIAKKEIQQTQKEAQAATKAQKEKAKSVTFTNESAEIFKENFTEIKNVIAQSTSQNRTQAAPRSTLPLRGSGDEIVNIISKDILNEADEAYKAVGVEGGLDSVIKGTAKLDAEAIEKLSLTHRVASNPEQIKSAVIRVAKDPEKAYFDFIASNAQEDSMAALYSALIRSDFIRSDVTRLNNIVRHFDKSGTRTAQELQARQMIGRLDYPNIISRILRKSEEVMKSRNINMADEVKKIEKALGDEFDKLLTISKTDAIEKINDITCKV